MNELLGLMSPKELSLTAVLVGVAIAVITDKLVWHTRLKSAEKRADRWERVALEALQSGAQAGVKAAEVAVGVVAALPDPQGEHERQSAGGKT